MADRVNFGDNRWAIVYGNYQGLEKYAVNELNKVISGYVPYILTLMSAHSPEEALKIHNLVFVGTVQSNRYIKQFAEQGLFTPNLSPQGYAVKTLQSPFHPERKITILCGADDEGTIYAVRDYEHFYVDPARYHHFDTVYNVPYRVFEQEMQDVSFSSAPAFAYRGLWTWGHVIYDYKRYLDNMSQWKLNLLTLWNDFAPVNAKDVVDYAHERGIRVVWGYSWCWGEEVDPNSAGDLEKWSARIIETFEKQYLPLGVDGLYFQTFTEHCKAEIGGRSAAYLAADWVNKISARLLSKYPDLWVQFGLHATAVKQDLKDIAMVDERLTIVWEDAGAFPYHHDPKNTAAHDEDVAFTGLASRLRGEKESFGVVLKGLTMLRWPGFEHQKGPFVLGEASQRYIKKRAEEKEFIWSYANAYWSKNLDYVLRVMNAINAPAGQPVVMSALMEDGMWEERSWFAGALFALAAWNPKQTKEELLEKLGLVQEIRHC